MIEDVTNQSTKFTPKTVFIISLLLYNVPISPLPIITMLSSFFICCILKRGIVLFDLADQVVGHYFVIFLDVVELFLRLGNSLVANFHGQIGVIHDFVEIDLEIDRD